MADLIIAGGGISGLSLGFLLAQNRDINVTVLEAEKRLGGKIWTERYEGHIVEAGVNAFLSNRPKTFELINALSLTPLRSSDSARRRFIYSGGRLNLLPESPPAFLASSLISLPGKLRIFFEPFIQRGRSEDETLAEFAKRRLGTEAYEKLIDPMASGIFAGDPEQMSLRSCFPRIYELEQKYGSLIRAMIALQKEAKKEGRKVGAGPGGVLTSFEAGMTSVVDTLSASLGERVRVAEKVVSLEKTKKGFVVYLKDGTRLEADAVALAVPAYEAQAVLKELDKNLSTLLEEIPYPPLSVVALSYKKDKLPKEVSERLNAFGFLVPSRERRKILGSLFDSSIFPNRAPEGHVLIRAMAGGAKAPTAALLSDAELIKAVQAELRDILGIKKEPEFVRIFRHERAIPQYHVGHSLRLNAIEERLSAHKGLYITGNALRGVGFNDCIENSYKLAERIREEVL